MPAVMTSLAASSALIFSGTTSRRGTTQTNPVGGMNPVGIHTMRLSRSPPGAMSSSSPVASPVM